jgi:hypothetical protein
MLSLFKKDEYIEFSLYSEEIGKLKISASLDSVLREDHGAETWIITGRYFNIPKERLTEKILSGDLSGEKLGIREFFKGCYSTRHRKGSLDNTTSA